MSVSFTKNKIKLRSELPSQSPCPYCNSIMKNCSDNEFNSVTIDHIKPRQKGGKNEINNLIPVCKLCNNRKSNREKMLTFRLITPRELQEEEYVSLSKYVEVKTRVAVLKRVKTLVAEGEFEEAIELINETIDSVVCKKFYWNLAQAIKSAIGQSRSILVQIKLAVLRIESRIKEENSTLVVFEPKIRHLDFTTYSLVVY